jgi:hypothetical protein
MWHDGCIHCEMYGTNSVCRLDGQIHLPFENRRNCEILKQYLQQQQQPEREAKGNE